MTSWAAPLNMMANVLDSLQDDPQVNKMMLGIAPAYDAMKRVPIDLLSNIPHFESEIEGSSDKSNTGSTIQQQPALGPGNPA